MSRSGRKPVAADHEPAGAADHNPSLTLALLLASILTGGIVGFLSVSPWLRVAGVTLTAATIWFSFGHLRGRWPFLYALLPGLGVLTLFASRVAVMTPPFLFPRLHVAGLAAWSVLAIALVLLLTRLTDEDRGFVIAFALGALFFLGEMVLPGPQQGEQERWEALYLDDPDTGPRFLPNTTARNLYADNPRRYFDRVDAWQLESHQGSLGRLERVAPDGSHLRVSIPRRVGDQNWQIKLLRSPFQLYIGRSYQLRFRARSDSIREINCAAGQNHEPWQLLSPYREVQLRREWNDYSCAFIAMDTDPNARVFFDLGKTKATVEISDISLYDLSRNAVVDPPAEFYMTYRFDSRGSRGPDRETPSPKNAYRIVLLGDSHTMGQGVREEDTFAARLERLLNDGRSPGDSTYFEVINSGLPGFDTRLERVLYETVSHLYEPDLVLVVMHYDDDMSSAEVEQAGFLPPPPRLSRLLGMIESATRRKRPWDYTRSIAELEALAGTVAERNQKMGVVFFRGDSAEPWDKLVADVTAGLQGKNVPMLDLGDALLGSEHSESELAVLPGYDHYNEIAHGIAAQALEQFLRAENLVPGTVLAANGGQ